MLYETAKKKEKRKKKYNKREDENSSKTIGILTMHTEVWEVVEGHWCMARRQVKTSLMPFAKFVLK